MSSKKWIVMFISTVLLLPLLLAACNFTINPFGVFGQNFLSWYSFSETLNPRVAKTEYLEEHHGEYDSYIIGCSSTSSYPAEALNKYLDADFYNLIMYGADMWDVEKTVEYITDNYEVKNLVLNVYIDNGIHYNEGEDSLNDKLHYKVSGKSGAEFYIRYLFASVNYSFDKLSALKNDTELSQLFDVFDEKTGAYDKRARDIENIGDMGTYLEKYPVFADYPPAAPDMGKITECMKSIKAVTEICDKSGINLYVVCAPVYAEYLQHFDTQQVKAFYSALAEVTPFYDFTYSSVSREPRYFYDATHFRNAVGDMAAAYMFGDKSVYIPEDFGAYVTEENVAEHVKIYDNISIERRDGDYTDSMPVLMYHHIDEDADSNSVVTPENFESQIKTLHDNGYTAVTLNDMYAYVYEGVELPEKPVLITFDDGYSSNYEIAFPILKKYGMKATIFAVGSSVGKDTYKDTDISIKPHFTYEQAKEMMDSGVISVQTHTYDMHQSQDYEEGEARTGAAMLKGESEQEFMEAMENDLTQAINEMKAQTGYEITALAYPNGVYSDLSQHVCRSAGIKATFTIEPRTNVLVKGLPQCLFGMGRYNVDDITGDELIEMIG